MNKQEIIARLSALMQQEELESVRSEIDELGNQYKALDETDADADARFEALWSAYTNTTADDNTHAAETGTEETQIPGAAVDTPDNAAAGSLTPETDTNSADVEQVSPETNHDEAMATETEPEKYSTENGGNSANAEDTQTSETATEKEVATQPEQAAELPDNKQDIIARLEALLKEEDSPALRQEVEALEDRFQQVADEQEEAQKKAFIEGGGAEDDFEASTDPEDNRLKEIENIFSERQEKQDAAREADEKTNLETRRRIVEDLKELVNSVVTGDRIAAAFEKFNNLRDEWRNTGNVPGRYYKQLQSDFSHQIDMFFYNVEIYRALKIHDFNKNLEAKKDLISKVKELVEEKSIKKIEDNIRLLQTEWSEIGPVKEEDWKDLRNDFWNTVNAVYDKVHAHYEGIRETQQKNLEAKEALVNQVKQISELELKSHKKWQEKTEEILNAQAEWKKLGYASRKDNERVWKEFRAACNDFFKQKKAFYQSLKEDNKAAREEKEMLIREAQVLKENTDWRDTTEAFKHLQQRWKEAGSAGPKEEQRLWKEFRTACDHFFEAKKQFFATKDERHETNLKEKEALLDEMEKFQLTGDNSKDLGVLKEFANKWRSIGHIPKNKIEETNGRYTKIMDGHYAALKMDKKEKTMARFSNKVESMENADQGDRMLEKEYRHVSDQVSKLKETIELYENNLSFFGPSKGAEALKQDVLKKIEQAKEELTVWQEKLKMLPKPARPQRPQGGGGHRGRGNDRRGGGGRRR